MRRSLWPVGNVSGVPAAILRDRLAILLAIATAICLAAAFAFSEDIAFLMPGPRASAHASIKNCASCHARSGTTKLSWVGGLVSGDPHADSKACLSCHKMTDTAFNPHGASAAVLKQSTVRLEKVAERTPEPFSSELQSKAFPVHDMVASGINCASCHQEHQGAAFKLAKISNEQCRSCHIVKFDSFDGNHPEFDSYPFRRRTRIIYDHAAHFDKHFPEVAKKDAAKRIPATCSTCHDSRQDKRIMAVAPFEQTCSGCHLDQITGKDRVSGPKGIAFLTLPGIDVETLRKKKAAIGEWPDGSEAEMTPFMKVMIGRTEQGRAVIESVKNLKLQELSDASDDQIKAATNLVWEIKRLFYALTSENSPDVLTALDMGGGANPNAALVADLTAGLPRDVVLAAQKQWLPNLAAEITGVPITKKPDASIASISGKASKEAASESAGKSPAPDADGNASASSEEKAEGKAAQAVKRDPEPCALRVFGQCIITSKAASEPPQSEAFDENSEKKSSATELPPAMRAGLRELRGAQVLAAADQAPRAAPKQSDDLLNLTEQEKSELAARTKGGGPSPADASSNSTSSPASDDSNIDAENWAEYGGWYRQDYAIYYRPSGHKDKFIYSWLSATGPKAVNGSATPAAAIFASLTAKDAQGACTKCHSVDDVQGRGRFVNFSPLPVAAKQGRFTSFIHEPHLTSGAQGCLSCHALAKERSYLKSYEQGNPWSFAGNFAGVKKDLCRSCHAASLARQDCLTCHKYHVNGVITPIMSTKNPVQ